QAGNTADAEAKPPDGTLRDMPDAAAQRPCCALSRGTVPRRAARSGCDGPRRGWTAGPADHARVTWERVAAEDRASRPGPGDDRPDPPRLYTRTPRASPAPPPPPS